MRNTIAKVIGTIALGAALVFSPYFARAAENPEKDETSLSANISSSFLNGFFAMNGPTMVDNPVNQTTISLENKWLMAYMWMNYDLLTDKTTEMDFSVKFKIPEFNFARGTVSGMAGYEAWTYPQGTPYMADHAAVLSLIYENWLKTQVTVKKVLTEEFDEGYLGVLEISKSIGLPSPNKVDLSLTPKISTAFLEKFYDGTGFPYVRAGVSLDVKLPKGFGLNASAFYQMSLDDEVSEDTPVFGVGVSKDF